MAKTKTKKKKTTKLNKKRSHFDAEKKLKETKLKRRRIDASDQIKTTKNQPQISIPESQNTLTQDPKIRIKKKNES